MWGVVKCAVNGGVGVGSVGSSKCAVNGGVGVGSVGSSEVCC